jgi:hypothetical protein
MSDNSVVYSGDFCTQQAETGALFVTPLPLDFALPTEPFFLIPPFLNNNFNSYSVLRTLFG